MRYVYLPRVEYVNHFSLKPSMAPVAFALCFLTHAPPDESSQYSVSQYVVPDSWIRSALMQNTGVSASESPHIPSLKP